MSLLLLFAGAKRYRAVGWFDEWDNPRSRTVTVQDMKKIKKRQKNSWLEASNLLGFDTRRMRRDQGYHD